MDGQTERQTTACQRPFDPRAKLLREKQNKNVSLDRITQNMHFVVNMQCTRITDKIENIIGYWFGINFMLMLFIDLTIQNRYIDKIN